MTVDERAKLSPWQVQVYELHEQGMTYREIARRLQTSIRSAQFMVGHVLKILAPTWKRRRKHVVSESLAEAKKRIARETAEGTRCPCGLTFDASHPRGGCDVQAMRQQILTARRG